MNTNPYIRQTLRATETQRLDPAVEADYWISQWEDCLLFPPEQEDSAWTWSLLSAAYRVLRFPEYYRPSELPRWQQQTESLLGPAGLQQVLGELPPASDWLAQAEQLSLVPGEPDSPPDEESELRLACELWTEFEDIEMLLVAAEERGIAAEPATQWLAQTRPWLEANAEEFFPASAYIQTLGHLIAPNLEQTAPKLQPSASKYPIILEVLQQVEDDLSGNNLPPLEDDWIEAIHIRFARVAVPAEKSLGWLPLEASLQMAASQAEEILVPQLYRWASPDGKYLALLTLAYRETGAWAETATLSLHWQDEALSPAGEFGGQSVQLGEAQAVLDEQATAQLPLSRLWPQAKQPPPVLVGTPAETWEYQDQA